MVSKVGVNNMAYLQNTQDAKEKKGSVPVNKTKELDKVGTIQQQIKNGTYHLDMNKTAKSVLDELI